MTRVLVIGIDAASADLVEAWSDRLPNIEALRSRGTYCRLHGLDDFFVGSTWPSFYTGLNPGVHGHHSLVQLVPGTYRYRRMADGALVHATPFWEHLSAAGRRVAVLDVPLSALSKDLNGIQTVEWGSHDALYGFRANSPALREQLTEQFGPHPIGRRCDGRRSGAEDYDDLVQRLIKGVETKAKITRTLLTTHDWDFAIQVFSEAHCAGHQAWHLHDRTHPAYDAGVAANVGDPLERVYRAIDAAVGDILADVSADTIVMLMSAHDMSYWYGAQFLLEKVLYALGVSVPRRSETSPPSAGQRMRQAADKLWFALPGPARSVLRPIIRTLRSRAETARRPPSIAADASRSLCFTVFNGQPVGGIRLNLAGREPNGRLQAAEVDEFCAQLSADLLSIIDLRNGEPAIRKVVRTKEISQGRSLDALPDLLVHWNDSMPTGNSQVGPAEAGDVTLTSAKIGTISGRNDYGRTGEHRPHGFCIFAGGGIAPDTLDTPVSLLDLAPTIAGFFGVELPECDGRSLTASIFDRAS